MRVASVNLWELITTVAGKDLPRSEYCREIQKLCSMARCFATELSLLVREDGAWEVSLFSHEPEDPSKIVLTVRTDGAVEVQRLRQQGDVLDSRTIRF